MSFCSNPLASGKLPRGGVGRPACHPWWPRPRRCGARRLRARSRLRSVVLNLYTAVLQVTSAQPACRGHRLLLTHGWLTGFGCLGHPGLPPVPGPSVPPWPWLARAARVAGAFLRAWVRRPAAGQCVGEREGVLAPAASFAMAGNGTPVGVTRRRRKQRHGAQRLELSSNARLPIRGGGPPAPCGGRYRAESALRWSLRNPRLSPRTIMLTMSNRTATSPSPKCSR